MDKLAEKKVALAKRILETEDEALLRSVDELVTGGPYTFTTDEVMELEAIRKKHIEGDGRSTTWPEARKRIRKAVEAKTGTKRA